MIIKDLDLDSLTYSEYLHFLNVIIEYFNVNFSKNLDIFYTDN